MKNFYRIIVFCLLISGCRNGSSLPEPIIETSSTETATPSASATPSYITVDAKSVSDASPPTLIEIPAVGLYHPVSAMEWEVTDVDGQRTTTWVVPNDAVGWHIDSVGVGAVGNVILSGHQEQGAAVFKSLSLGSVQPGQNVTLTDDTGQSYVYQVNEVSEPIPLEGTTPEQFAQMERYYEQSDQALLTLITGWPDFATTHRLFVVAELVGMSN